MKIITILIFSICSTFLKVYGQTNHEEFIKQLKDKKIDSIYNSYSSVKKNEDGYEEALIFRNNYGWALGKTEELKKDIPELINLYKGPYKSVFDPQRFPPTEWEHFYRMSDTLQAYFVGNTIVLKEILFTKTFLSFLLMKDENLATDLPQLLELLDNYSPEYSSMLWQYGQLLIRQEKWAESLVVFEKGYKLKSGNEFLDGIVTVHFVNKSYKKVTELSSEILKSNTSSMLFELAYSYLQLQDTLKAKTYFDLFSSRFEFIDYHPFVQIQESNHTQTIKPTELETLGDFYLDDNKENACKYYRLAEAILTSESQDFLTEKRLRAIVDEKKKFELNEKYENHKRKNKEISERIRSKLTQCDQ